MRIKSGLFLGALAIILASVCAPVSAATNKLTIADASVLSKSSTTTAENLSYTDNTFSSNITFTKQNDYIELGLTLENTSSEEWAISSIEDNLTNENLDAEYTYPTETMAPGDSTNITIKLIYVSQVKNVEKISLDNLEITIDLRRTDGSEEEDKINPKTEDNILTYIVASVVAIAGLICVIITTKNKKVKVAAIIITAIAAIVLPVTVLANEGGEAKIYFTNIDLVGEFETYDITIDPNDGDTPITKQVQYGQKIGELPNDPSKDGYYFNNWQDENGNTITSDTIITSPIDISAKYTPITYHITYDLAGGIVDGENKTEYTIETESFNLINPTLQGYIFSGWTKGTSEELQTRVTVLKGTYGDLSFTAHYSADPNTNYTVTHKYEPLEGEEWKVDIEHLQGTTGTSLTPAFREKTGFRNPNPAQIEITPDGEANLDYIYTREEYTLTLTDADYIDTSATSGQKYKFGTEITLTAKEKEGYTFSNWTNGETGQTITLTIKAEENIIGPEYSLNKVTVSFDTDGGSEVPNQIIDYGTKATRPETDPMNSDLTFNGWYTTDSYETAFNFDSAIKADTTIYAQFIVTCTNFSNHSWDTIVANQKDNPSYYPIGCKKEVEIDMNDDGAPESYTVRLANTSTPEVCSTEGYSQTACGVVIEFIDTIGSRQMNVNSVGGWRATPTVLYLNTDFYDKLPADLKHVIIPTYPIVSGSGGTSESLDIIAADANKNKLYLLSTREINASTYYDDRSDELTDTRTLDLYTNTKPNTQKAEVRVRKNLDGVEQSWWLRSGAATDSTGYCRSYNQAYLYVRDLDTFATTKCASTTYAIAPAFRIGIIDSYTVNFDENGGIVSVKSATKDKDEPIGELPTPTSFPEGKDEFIGWYTELEGGYKIDETYTPNADVTIYARYYVDPCKPFIQDSWETISNNVKNDPDYYLVGCEKEVEMDMNNDEEIESYTVRLSNNSTPEVCETYGYSQTACGTVIEFVDIPAYRAINSTGNTYGGWKSSTMVSWLNNEFYNKLPSDLRDVIIPTYPIVSGSGRNGSPNISSDDASINKLYLLSTREIGYNAIDDNKKDILTDTRTLDYYSKNNTDSRRIKYDKNGIATRWWTRTPSSGSYDYWLYVPDNGGPNHSTQYLRAGTNNGVSPAFRIGKNTNTLYYNATDGTVPNITKEVSKGNTIGTLPQPTPYRTSLIFDGWYTELTGGETVTPELAIDSDTTIYARYIDTCTTFSTDSWTTIKNNLENDPNYYPIDCQKEVEIDMNNDGTAESYTIRLANSSTPEVCAVDGYSQTACGIVIEFVDILEKRRAYSTTNDGWANNALATYLNGEFYNKLPGDLREVIIPSYPIVSGSSSTGTSPNITKDDTTKNKIYLLSGKEVGFNATNDNKKDETKDTRILDFYSNNNNNRSRYKRDLDGNIQSWALRTTTDRASHLTVDTSGGPVGYGQTSGVPGISPAFRIAKHTHTISYDANGGSVDNPTKETMNTGQVGELATPVSEDGLTFLGWFTETDGGEKITSELIITDDITIYAHWDNNN